MIRPATIEDADILAHIYNQTVTEQAYANCDLVPVTPESRAAYLTASGPRYPTFIHVSDEGRTMGFGSLKKWSARPNCPTVAEIAVYVELTARGGVVGGELGAHLISVARELDFTTLIAIIIARNETSIRGSQRLGFREVVRLREVAWVRDDWVDLVWLQKDLADMEEGKLLRFLARTAQRANRGTAAEWVPAPERVAAPAAGKGRR